MMRQLFNDQLAELNAHIHKMEQLNLKLNDQLIHSLENPKVLSLNHAMQIVKEVRRSKDAVETLCTRMLYMQQPVASDLKTISLALKRAPELERIAELSLEFFRLLESIEPDESFRKDLSAQAETCKDMLETAILASSKQDPVIAKKVILMDDQADGQFESIKKKLAAQAAGSYEQAQNAFDLYMSAKYLERMADHCEKLADLIAAETLFSL